MKQDLRGEVCQTKTGLTKAKSITVAKAKKSAGRPVPCNLSGWGEDGRLAKCASDSCSLQETAGQPFSVDLSTRRQD